jgi:Flp pilus assembly protein TadG
LKRRQGGLAVVEFALIGLIFFGFMFAIIEISWWLFSINALTEMSRLGARKAAVCTTCVNNACSTDSSSVEKIVAAMSMGGVMGIKKDEIDVATDVVLPGTVTVTINHTYKPLIPGLHLMLGSKNPIGFSMPAFSTTLPVESDECP